MDAIEEWATRGEEQAARVRASAGRMLTLKERRGLLGLDRSLVLRSRSKRLLRCLFYLGDVLRLGVVCLGATGEIVERIRGSLALILDALVVSGLLRRPLVKCLVDRDLVLSIQQLLVLTVQRTS